MGESSGKNGKYRGVLRRKAEEEAKWDRKGTRSVALAHGIGSYLSSFPSQLYSLVLWHQRDP